VSDLQRVNAECIAAQNKAAAAITAIGDEAQTADPNPRPAPNKP